MHRLDLLDKLRRYQTLEPFDAECRDRIIAFVEQNPLCFERSLTIGHITGSAWLTNPTRSRFLLTFHKKLNLWLQLGGHADGNSDNLAVALKEAQEESGITDIRPVSPEIFDLDVHLIPEYRGVQEHFHYDIRFLCEADDAIPLAKSDESHELRWVSAQEVRDLTTEESIMRMLQKSLSRGVF